MNEKEVKESKEVGFLKEAMLSGEGVKRQFADNYIKILLQKHPALDLKYIVNFLHKAQITGANPAMDEIYLIERKTKNSRGEWDVVGSVVFNYRFFLQKAKENPKYQTVKTIVGVGDYFNPISSETIKTLFCTATVLMENNCDVSFTAWFPEFVQMKDEYVNKEKTGNQTPVGLWASKPYFMIEKCAIANASRWAAPKELSGMYIEEESGIENAETDKRNDFIEAESKKVEVVQRIEKSKELREEKPQLESVIGEIKTHLATLTDGMKSVGKAAFMFEKIGIKSFKELSCMSLEEVKEICSNLEKLATEKEVNRFNEAKNALKPEEIIKGDMPKFSNSFESSDTQPEKETVQESLGHKAVNKKVSDVKFKVDI